MTSIPPIVRLAERLLADIEQAVARWNRSHRYTHGARLRDQAMTVAIVATLAWRERDRRATHVHELVRAIDVLKLCLQLGSRIRAFASLRQFEALSRLAHDLGRQAGGWAKQFPFTGQNVESS